MQFAPLVVSHDTKANGNSTNHRRLDYYGAVSSSSSTAGTDGVGVVVVKKERADQRIDNNNNNNKKASIANEIANITKNLIGSGVFSLPAGLAMYSNSNGNHQDASLAAMVADVVLTTSMAALLAYFCLLIARVCARFGATTYMDCWQATVGRRGAMLVAMVNALCAGGGDLASATILSQTLQTLLLSWCGVRISRLSALLLLTLGVLWPLCRHENLYHFAFCSIVATTGMVCTALLMVVRSIDGTYAPGGIYYSEYNDNAFVGSGNFSSSDYYQANSTTDDDDDDDDLHSSSSSYSLLHLLPLVGMLFSAFIMHYNCPRFYAELQDASVARFGTAVGWSFTATALLYVVMTVAAYATFGGQCDSFILNNYHVRDPLASVGRVAVFVSTTLNYPLAFFGCRDGFANAWNISSPDQTEWLTAGLIVVITVLAAFITDLAVINAVTGGIFATAIAVLFPTIMFTAMVTTNDNHYDDHHHRRHLWLPHLLCALGLVSGLVGAYMAVAT
jgi:amino acid permease